MNKTSNDFHFLGIRIMGLRPKTPGSTCTNMSSLDLNSASANKSNGRMLKSNSSSALTNTSFGKEKH